MFHTVCLLEDKGFYTVPEVINLKMNHDVTVLHIKTLFQRLHLYICILKIFLI